MRPSIVSKWRLALTLLILVLCMMFGYQLASRDQIPEEAVARTASKVSGWLSRPASVSFVQSPEGAVLSSPVSDPGIQSIGLRAEAVSTVEIVMKSNGGGTGEIFWFTPTKEHRHAGQQKFPVKHDGEWHTYSVRVAEASDIRAIRIDPSAEAGQQVIAEIRLLNKDGR